MNDLSTAGVEKFDRDLLDVVENWLFRKGWTIHRESRPGAKRYKVPWTDEEGAHRVPFRIEDACMMQVYRDEYWSEPGDDPLVVLFAWLGNRGWKHLAGTFSFSYRDPAMGWDYDIEYAILVQVYREERKRLGIEDRELEKKKRFFMMARPR